MSKNQVQANIFQVDISLAIYRSHCLHVFHKICVHENLVKFTGQHKVTVMPIEKNTGNVRLRVSKES